MKTTRTAIHKLTIQADCGCIAFGEYKDEALKQIVAGPLFSPCAAHKDDPGSSAIEGLMKEMVTHTAAETKIALPPVASAPSVAPAHLDDEVSARRAARTGVTAPVAAGAQAVSSAPTPVSVQSGTATRTPLPVREGGRQPGVKQPMVVGGKPGGVRRHDPRTAGQAASAAARSGLKVASPATSVDMDMDGAPEDRRVTALLENSGVLDDGMEDEGIEFD